MAFGILTVSKGYGRHPSKKPPMILRSLDLPAAPSTGNGSVAHPAYEGFVAHQKEVKPPYLPVPQPARARLAGSLAQALLPSSFGPVSDEVIEAIRQHDYGWMGSNRAQLDGTRNDRPIRSFPQLAAEAAVPAWNATVRLAKMSSPLIGVLVNRHFCLLSDDNNPLHQHFLDEAKARREPAEAQLGMAPEDLDRWTAALGVCGLLSLYLCSGCTEAVEFPFCHPADKQRREQAAKTTLHWEDGVGHWSQPLLRLGTRVAQAVAKLDGGWEELSWQIS